MRTHWHLASLALTPPGPSLALCTAGSVSKDVCLFLEQGFISFHFNCLLLSWACESAGLCYKGEPQPCGPNVAASCTAKSILCFIGYHVGHEYGGFYDFVESGGKPCSVTGSPRIWSWCCGLLAVWPWTSPFPSLGFRGFCCCCCCCCCIDFSSLTWG